MLYLTLLIVFIILCAKTWSYSDDDEEMTDEEIQVANGFGYPDEDD